MNSGDWLYSSWAEQYCGLTVIVWMLSLVCWLYQLLMFVIVELESEPSNSAA